MADVTMPQLGEAVTEGMVTKWLKSVGEAVERDEPLFEVSTDKVDTEVPAPASGVLSEILVEEGETVEVGTRLAVIGDGAAVAQPPPPPAPPAEPEAPPAPPAAAPVPEAVAPAAPAAVPSEPPPMAPVPPTIATRAGGAPAAAGTVLSPLVRKVLDEAGIDPATVAGTGAGGRITREDAERAAAGAATPATAGAPARPAAPAGPAPGRATPFPPSVPGGRDEVIPFTNVRRRTAEHMLRSRATSAHTLMVREIDYEGVERVRRAVAGRFREEEGFNLHHLPFISRAVVEALVEYPRLNASVGDDALIVHRDINLGIAVDLDNEGLIVPVIHRAEELTVRGMARRIREVAERARTRALSADDITGGTFSITNPGPFGTLMTGAIINQPQVAVLSTDTVTRKPVVVTAEDGTEAIAIHSVGLLALNFDHRAVDGAYAARFLRRIDELLQGHDWASEV